MVEPHCSKLIPMRRNVSIPPASRHGYRQQNGHASGPSSFPIHRRQSASRPVGSKWMSRLKLHCSFPLSPRRRGRSGPTITNREAWMVVARSVHLIYSHYPACGNRVAKMRFRYESPAPIQPCLTLHLESVSEPKRFHC